MGEGSLRFWGGLGLAGELDTLRGRIQWDFSEGFVGTLGFRDSPLGAVDSGRGHREFWGWP